MLLLTASNLDPMGADTLLTGIAPASRTRPAAEFVAS